MTTDVQPLNRTITAHGLRLHYLDWGGGCVGPGAGAARLRAELSLLGRSSAALRSRLRLRALDQRGHGRSQWANEMREYTRDHMVRDIEAAVAGLELERPVLIGHSMGGGVAMTFAARHPEQVRALVLVDTGPEVSPEGAERVHEFVAGPYVMDSLDAWVEHTAKYYPHRSKDGIRKRLAVSLRETPDGDVREAVRRTLHGPGIREGTAGQPMRSDSGRAGRSRGGCAVRRCCCTGATVRWFRWKRRSGSRRRCR